MHEAPRSIRTHPLPPSPMEWDASPPLGLGKLCQHNFGHTVNDLINARSGSKRGRLIDGRRLKERGVYSRNLF